jgi:5-formyltetrahydrofolate cyclo-ligase
LRNLFRMTTPAPSIASQKRTLRKTLRVRRQALSAMEQRQAAQGLVRQIRRHPDYLRTQRIALYQANDGEIDPGLLAQRLVADGKSLFLPVLNPLDPVHPHLWFCSWKPGQPMRSNRFGIPEPANPERIPAWTLDWVLMPLVGFDADGGRLGAAVSVGRDLGRARIWTKSGETVSFREVFDCCPPRLPGFQKPKTFVF